MHDTISVPRSVLRHLPPAAMVDACNKDKLGRFLLRLEEDELEDLLGPSDEDLQAKVVGILSATRGALSGSALETQTGVSRGLLSRALHALQARGRVKPRVGTGGVTWWSLVGMGAPKRPTREKTAAPAKRATSPRAPAPKKAAVAPEPKEETAKPARSAPTKVTPDQIAAVRAALGSEARTCADLATRVHGLSGDLSGEERRSLTKRALDQLVKEGVAATEGTGRWTKYALHPAKANGASKEKQPSLAFPATEAAAQV